MVILFSVLVMPPTTRICTAGWVGQAIPEGRVVNATDEVLDYLNAALAAGILGRFFSMAIVGVIDANWFVDLGVPVTDHTGRGRRSADLHSQRGPPILAAVPQSLCSERIAANRPLWC